MKLGDLVVRVNQLLKKGEDLEETSYYEEFGHYVNSAQFTNFQVSTLNFLKRLFGEDSPSYRTFESRVSSNYLSSVEEGLAILDATKEELEGGWLVTAKGLISAEVFSDFLEMAEYLLDEGYKDAAAVIIGSTLEGHLRQLCQKNSIPITTTKAGKTRPKKADLLNAELTKKGVYSKIDQKNVTAQLAIRNEAAHGNYSSYTDTQVKTMYQTVLEFMARAPV